MKYMFVKLPQQCGCIFAAKMWNYSKPTIVTTGMQVPLENADDRSKIIWVYVHPECKQVNHAVEYP